MAPKVSVATARTALQGYKRQLYQVDPDDQEQIDQYIEMRTKFSRVSPAQFLKFMETNTQEVKAGTTSQMSYWAVPKTNFPQGLPNKIKAAEVGEDDGEEGTQVEVDRQLYFVVDQCVPREQLAKGVWIVTAFNATENKFQTKGPGQTQQRSLATSGAQPQAGGDSDDEPNESAGASTETRVALRGDRRLQERPSHGEAEDDDPNAKQAKVIKQTLVTLKGNIETAKQAGIWVSKNTLANNSVLFWVEQTIDALEEMVADSGNRSARDQAESVVKSFTCYLIELAQETDCYPHWVAFKGLLPRLIAAGGASMAQRTVDEAKLLESLANTKPDQAVAVDVEGASVLSRAQFYNSAIYRSYVMHMVNGALKLAQQATNDNDRMAAVSPWAQAKGIPDALAKTIDQAMHMFSPDIELADRISFMVSEKLCKMARHWDATGPMGVAAQLHEDAPDLAKAKLPYGLFCKVAKAIRQAELAEQITNPLIMSAVILIGDLAEQERIVAHCLEVRLGVLAPESVDAPDAELIQSIATDDLGSVAQKVKSFFARVSDLPPWVTGLQEEAKKQKGIRDEAKAAKAAEAAATHAAAAAAATAAAPEAPATEELAAATGAAAAAAAAATVFTIGSEVIVSFGKGDNDLNQKKAKVTGVLTGHCWVELIEGPAKGKLKKILKTNLKLVNPVPAEPVTAAEEIPDAVGRNADAANEAVEAPPPAALVAGDTADWQDAANVFC